MEPTPQRDQRRRARVAAHAVAEDSLTKDQAWNLFLYRQLAKCADAVERQVVLSSRYTLRQNFESLWKRRNLC